MKIEVGKPLPLGATACKEGVNFAIYSKHATRVVLCLDHPQTGERILETPLNRTGDSWHVWVQGSPLQVRYTYRIEGPLDPKGRYFFNHEGIVDPYAKALDNRKEWRAEPKDLKTKGVVITDPSFDWQQISKPGWKAKDLVIYEMHVRGFTQDPSSQVQECGSYAGIIEKIPYLKDLGINAVELLPLFEFDENSYQKRSPVSDQELCNYWGYSTLHFFSAMNRYSATYRKTANPLDTLIEFKTMVRELHRAGIEVILDVVFNHTGESPQALFSFLGLEAPTYYLMDPQGHFQNFTGCSNTVNCNHPIVRTFIIAALRYWAIEMQVDGFRFDLASIFTRARNGAPMALPPLLEELAEDPVLSNVKLIAEPWDAAGLYQIGHFPSLGPWSEWNGRFRDAMRLFIKGTGNSSAGAFAKALSGSQDTYGYCGRPWASINFITCHDGFSLYDLVSYNQKHNLGNGEENRDGLNENISWNCGAEGPTDNEEILRLRKRQMRNFHLALMVSQGIPMLLMGDEYGHSGEGNNNRWCHDTPLNWFAWNKLKEDEGWTRFYKELIHFRHRHPLLRRSSFLDPKSIKWHGTLPNQQAWAPGTKFVAFTLKDLERSEDLYVAFNAHFEELSIKLPRALPHHHWVRICDTSLPSPQDFMDEKEAPRMNGHYKLQGHSALLLKSIS